MQKEDNHNEHPTPEEWMGYLYGELDSKEKGTLTEHLQDCTSCQTAVVRWQKVTDALDAWPLSDDRPEKRHQRPVWQRLTRWAVAAILFMGLGYVGSKYFRPTIGPNEFQATLADLQQQWQADVDYSVTQVKKELREQFDREMNVMVTRTMRSTNARMDNLILLLAESLEQQRREDQQMIFTIMEQMEIRQYQEDDLLRDGMYTLAALTDRRLQNRKQMLQFNDLDNNNAETQNSRKKGFSDDSYN